uniref:Uncharacterized protein n=1 Tax=Lepeophtheirus salmonis TaxID=72036 RepID=A0A0K2UZA6_LEPSM
MSFLPVTKKISELVHRFGVRNQVRNNAHDLHHFHDEIIMIQRALKANDIDLEDTNVRRFVIPLLDSKVSCILRDGRE